MEFASISTPAAAFVAGLVTSLHCAGMCGPLACMLIPSRGERVDPGTVATVYQVSRVAGYTLLGAAVGAVGGIPAAWTQSWPVRLMPWVLVLYFVAVALRLGDRLPRLRLLSRIQSGIQGWVRGRPRLQVAAAMGAATPLLPCGPLYFLLAISALSGSAVRGAEFMLSFAMGTVPLLWLAQANFGWFRSRLSPGNLARTRTAVALVAAVVITWRLRGTLGLAGPDAGSFICF